MTNSTIAKDAASSTATVLSVRDARKDFGSQIALAGAGFDLAAGEWLGLLGPNGAGKTTLVRAVTGRVALDAGTIEIMGQAAGAGGGAGGRDSARRHLGMIPQQIALYPKLTAIENLRAMAAAYGLDRRGAKDRIAWALAWTGLESRANDRAGTFSGGMQRRLNIAGGILHKPKVVLLDEPTVGVDPQSRQRIWEMLESLRADGAALLLTTHQLDEAQQVCDRIVVIDGGRTIRAGTLDELIASTIGASRRVTFHLEAPPESVPDGMVAEGERAVACSIDDLGRELPGAIERVRGAGAVIRDVSIHQPSLQDVFIHLTGRELRE